LNGGQINGRRRRKSIVHTLYIVFIWVSSSIIRKTHLQLYAAEKVEAIQTPPLYILVFISVIVPNKRT